MRNTPLLLSALLLIACGKSTPAPEPAPPTTAPPAPQADAEATASPDTLPAPATDTVTPKVEVDTNTYLVWWQTDRGEVTSWVVADGEGIRIEASRPQITLFADETLFGLETRYVPFTETTCEDFENGRKTRGGKRWLPYLVAKGLAGRDIDQIRELTPPKSGYIADEPPADGVFELVGEHWGRTHKFIGSWRDLLLVTDCEGSYGCGAHGDVGCMAHAVKLGSDAPTLDVEQVAKHVDPLANEFIKAWASEDSELVPEFDHFGLKSKDGAVVVDYVYTASVPYSGSDGSWSSYSQSRTFTSAPVEALNLGPLPVVVQKALQKAGVDGHFGWSIVKPSYIEPARRAFDDPTTLPGPAPADEVAPADTESPTTLIETGRKLSRDKDYAGAITAFDKAIAAEPKLARAWSGRGFAKLGQDELAGAKADFEQALTLEDAPKFQAAVFFNLGQIAEKQNDPTAALSHYEKANTLSPSNAAKKRIEALQKR